MKIVEIVRAVRAWGAVRGNKLLTMRRRSKKTDCERVTKHPVLCDKQNGAAKFDIAWSDDLSYVTIFY